MVPKIHNNLYNVKIERYLLTMAVKKKQYHHGDLRKALVDAAAALAAESGPEVVTLRAVAKRAGVSHAAPYHHFSGKAEILHAVALEGFRLMNEEMRRAALRTRKKKPFDRLAALGVAYIRFAARHTHYFKAMFRGVEPNKNLPDEQKLDQQNFQALILSVQACIGERGEPSKRTLELVLTAWSIVHGMASLWIEDAFRNTLFAKAKINDMARVVTESCRTSFELR